MIQFKVILVLFINIVMSSLENTEIKKKRGRKINKEIIPKSNQSVILIEENEIKKREQNQNKNSMFDLSKSRAICDVIDILLISINNNIFK
jgi:hypothetical protein